MSTHVTPNRFQQVHSPETNKLEIVDMQIPLSCLVGHNSVSGTVKFETTFQKFFKISVAKWTPFWKWSLFGTIFGIHLTHMLSLVYDAGMAQWQL